MAATDRTTVPALEVRRVFSAPRERVYQAFTDPEALSRWFAPTDEHTVTLHQFDLRVGGRYRLEMRHTEGAVHVVGGEFRELVPHERLAYTWKWEARPEMPDTLVSIRLTERDGKTELLLVHSLFDSVEDREGHGQGWDGCLARLAKIL
ncbi:MAG: SRPBCC domain-containing protein [Gemmatimonadales bacterium]